jgi:hypothetical protein
MFYTFYVDIKSAGFIIIGCKLTLHISRHCTAAESAG